MVNLEEKSHYEVDKDKQEIRLTLPTQLELEKLVDINDASVKASQTRPESQKGLIF